MEGYIYKITSLSGRVYIGQTINLSRRKSDYAANKSSAQTKIYRSIQKYGWTAHTFEVIETITTSDDIFKKLNEQETYWITFYDSMNNGLNCTSGGGRFKVSNETRDLMSIAARARTISPETRKKIIESNRKTREARKHIPKIYRPMTAKHIKKISESLTNVPWSEARKIAQLTVKNKTYGGKIVSSKFKGVSFDKNRNKWTASVNHKEHGRKRIGRYDTELQAFEAIKNYQEIHTETN